MNLFKTLIFVFLFVVCFASFILAKKSEKNKCKVCEDLVDEFTKNLKKTSKGNFGGGNTDWEDRKLGNYLFSETRFEEIIEKICSESECHKLLEEQEDTLFDWFKNKQNKIDAIMQKEFCINHVKYCCPVDKYGKNCEPCLKKFDKVCSGNGDCQGSGTRQGNGSCACNSGYKGDLCTECSIDFYVEKDSESEFICSECHKSCRNCLGPGENSCLSCKQGWKFNDEIKICDDINECLVNENPCNSNQYCLNNEGSFDCNECDKSCVGCIGSGPNKCLECKKDGFRSIQNSNSETECQDIDECQETPNICGENRICVNTPGSYECKGVNNKNSNNKKIRKNFNKENDEAKENLSLIKRTILVGLTLLCCISGYFTRQYVLLILSAAFGILTIFLTDLH